MKEEPIKEGWTTFTSMDRYREQIAAQVFEQCLDHFLLTEGDCITNAEVKARIATEAVEWADSFLEHFYADRVEVNPTTRVDLHREIRDSREGT